MTSIHYSWWLFHKINQKSLNKDIGHKVRTISRFMDTMLKNKVVHLSTLHGKTFEIPPIFFQQENCNFYCKRKQFFLQQPSSLTGEKSPSLLYLSYFYTKKVKKWLGRPKWPLGFPTLCFPNASFFQKGFYKLLNQLQN